MAKERQRKEHGDGEAGTERGPLRQPESQGEGRVEQPGHDHRDAVVDVDRAEVEAGLAAKREPAGGAGIVHPEEPAEQPGAAAPRTTQGEAAQESLESAWD